jgi:ribosomal protein L20
MGQYGETIKATTSPKVVTYNKFLEILQNNQVGVAVKSLCEIASKENY